MKNFFYSIDYLCGGKEMKIKFLIIFFIMFLSSFCVMADVVVSDKNDNDEVISLTQGQIINLSKKFIADKKFDDARVLLSKSPFNVLELEIERLFLLADINMREGNIDEAIEIYRFILDYQPNLSSVRLRLAEAYFLQKSWWRADYHFRLAGSDKNLPSEVYNNIAMALFMIRQNKNWNVWFNFGAAPDNNINNANSGEQCIMTVYGILCNELPDPEKAVGFNVSFGANYEFKFSDTWRLRNEFMVYNSSYDKSEYDDLYLAYNVGGKYIYKGGEVFMGLALNRRWLDHTPYSYSVGLKLNSTYDFTKNFSGAFAVSYAPMYYDDFKDILDGEVVGVNARFSYAFDASKYLVLKLGGDDENTKDKVYSNIRKNVAVGFGAELPYGFSVYLEPSIQYQDYDKERWFVKDYLFSEIKEKNITRKYSISFSNRKLKLFGFSPTITYSYIDKNSNVWQREYNKSTVEFTVNQSF